jgi:acyl carrier protein
VAGDGLPELLRNRLARTLPLPMLPTQLLVVDALPLTGNGKLDRQALLRRAAEAGPGEAAATAYAAPRNEVERALGEIWAAALGVPRVSVLDNFFDLGGHSLLLTEVQAQIRQRLGRELPLLKLFEHPTVGSLAAHLAGDVDGVRAADSAGDDEERARRQLAGLELQRQRMAAHRRALD